MGMTCAKFSSIKAGKPLILVENEKRDLTWTGGCNDHTCKLCNTLVGNSVVVPHYVNDIVFETDTEERIRIIARIEKIK